MGSEADRRGYFEGPNFIRVEEQKFQLGEFVSYQGLSQITKVEITQYRKEPGSTIRENRDAPYYHVINMDTGERNQEFNGTLKKDKLGQLIYGKA